LKIGHLASHCPKGSRKIRKHEKSTWWVGSNDDHQVISKDCKEPLQDSENPSQTDPPIQHTLLSQVSCHNSTQKPKKEASSLQVSDKGLWIQQSPQPSTCWEDQVDVAEVSDQEKQEASDQENLGIIDITNDPTSVNEVWMSSQKEEESTCNITTNGNMKSSPQVRQKGELFPNKLI
jgi:hypothetical protein